MIINNIYVKYKNFFCFDSCIAIFFLRVLRIEVENVSKKNYDSFCPNEIE